MIDSLTQREPEGPWLELHRRKVVRWGIAYVASAWGSLQGLDYATSTFDWPRQVQQFSTLAVVIGLPVVLVLAWFHGDRGQRRVTTTEIALLTALGIVGGSVLWLYEQRHEASRVLATVASPAINVAADDKLSIAVLPFENRSRLENDAFFVDGIHDDILTQLSKLSALRVISRTSVNRFRETDLGLREIAEQLGVTKILEGGVQRAGDRVRINVQLIDASSDAHLWAESYDRELTVANIFAIQSEIAAAIAGELQASLTAGERARANAIPTQSLEAWQAYQIGKQRMALRTSDALTRAEEHFRTAVNLDPKFALGWVGLADVLQLQTIYGSRPRVAALDDAEQAVAKAMALDPDLAEAWASAGGLANARAQLERAERMLRRAIALNPNYAPAHHWLAFALMRLCRREEALPIAERAVALDPLSAVINGFWGHARAGVGRFDDALAAFRQAIEIDPNFAFAYVSIGDLYAAGFGRFDKAMPWYEKAASLDPSPNILASLMQAHWELGNDAEVRRWLPRVLALGDGIEYSNYVAALVFREQGEDEPARKYAELAVAMEPANLFLIRDVDLSKGDYATARGRYAKSLPRLFAQELPALSDRETFAAIDLALVLQHTGENERAKELLDRSEANIRNIPRMGLGGYGIADVAIHALRGETVVALNKLREAQQAGWHQRWRYYRDVDPNLESIRSEPEFKIIFADIGRDMARQRAELAARSGNPPLNVAAVR